MKINEKNLAAFATSATPVDREGWLVKRGEVNKGYQRRWFVLKGNLLFYFEKRGEKEPVGVVVLEGCTIELSEDEDQFSFKIVFHGPGNRSYILGAESQESMEQWMKALACASYDYMKLMVADLQRQLDEMEVLSNACSEEMIQVDVLVELAPKHQRCQWPVAGDACKRGKYVLTTEVAGGPSPQPPPRTRHNPFNRGHTSNGSVTHHMRSHSVRSAPARADNTTRPENTSRHRITFRELHTAYGRPILRDRNEWRHQQKLEQDKKDVPLITL